MNTTILRISEFDDKEKMLDILKRNNYEVFVEFVYIPTNVETTHWKLTIFNRDDMSYIDLDQTNPAPVLNAYESEISYTNNVKGDG